MHKKRIQIIEFNKSEDLMIDLISKYMFNQKKAD